MDTIDSRDNPYGLLESVHCQVLLHCLVRLDCQVRYLKFKVCAEEQFNTIHLYNFNNNLWLENTIHIHPTIHRILDSINRILHPQMSYL